MATPVIMPRQGQSVESCIITQWLKNKGDQVAVGDILFSYETDKAAFDEESTVSGTLLEVFFEEGDEVPVLTNVCVIGNEGEKVDEFHPVSGIVSEVSKVEPESEKEKTSVPETLEAGKEEDTSGKLKVSPRARKAAGEKGIVLENLKGTGPKGRIIERDVLAAENSQPVITPLARKKMEMDHLAYDNAKFSKGDRVTSKDLYNAEQKITSDSTEYKKVPLTNIRKIIADAMHRSLQNSAQLTHHLSADARMMLELRSWVKKEKESGNVPNITLNDMVCYATIKALQSNPEANAHFTGDTILQFTPVHLGIAVDTDRGLMVPVLKNAQDFSLAGLSRSLKKIAEQCQTGKIDPDLLSPEAATFTVSNLGVYGVEMFTPVLNLPQVGILGVNTITSRPADTGGGVLGFVPHIGLSLTYNHQALDGAPASRFLKAIKDEIEKFDPVI
jgi:pyruvate dehydrogenase E2 component (dihydrolipoamide acetyltransferase)